MEELVELHASSELCLTRLAKVYLAKVREKLSELDTSSELCPTNFARVHLARDLGKS